MKRFYSFAAAAVLAFTVTPALADDPTASTEISGPRVMSDAELDAVVGGQDLSGYTLIEGPFYLLVSSADGLEHYVYPDAGQGISSQWYFCPGLSFDSVTCPY